MLERTRRGEVGWKAVWGACALLLAAAAPAGAQGQTPATRPLSQLSIEELLSVEITTASRKEQPLSTTPAAVYVITAEDIRRSGLTSLPEILRMAPGLQVARIDSNKWAISARGFNTRFANKMQVLIDGRSVYTPLFSGVLWEQQDLLLEDIERIEVIRGPGAAVWGANAMNGVINVVTKQARATAGTLVVLGTGNEDQGRAAVRWGGSLGRGGAYRVYTKAFTRRPWNGPVAGGPADDLSRDAKNWQNLESGFRVDLSPSSRDEVTVHGDAYGGRFDQVVDVFRPATVTMSPVLDRANVRGGNLLSRWTRQLDGPSTVSIQAFYDYSQRREAAAGEARHTIDVEFQHRRALARRHDLVWGVDFRTSRGRVSTGETLQFSPASETDILTSVYANDEIALASGRVALTLGARAEHSRIARFEIEPSVRVAWTPRPSQTVWAAVSRAARIPSRGERSMRGYVATDFLPNGMPYALAIVGTPDLLPETLVAYEAGWRVQPSNWLSLDATAFVNRYGRLILYEPAAPELRFLNGMPLLTVPLVERNGGGVGTGGVELALTARPLDAWRVDATYTWFEGDRAGVIGQVVGVMGANPEQQATLRSLVNLPHQLELDAMVSYTGELALAAVPAYTRADVRVGWRPAGPLELSVGAQNLFGAPHAEFGRSFNEHPALIGRSSYVKVTWLF
jgi:iron complex outermembrane receptor protein